MKMLKAGQAHIMASDCHNVTTRPPNLAMGISVVEKKLGADVADEIKQNGLNLNFKAEYSGRIG